MEHIVLFRRIQEKGRFSLVRNKTSTFISQFLSILRGKCADCRTKICCTVSVMWKAVDSFAQTQSRGPKQEASHCLCDQCVCVFQRDSWTSVSHKHPSWLIILSSVSSFNSAHNTNTQLQDPPPLSIPPTHVADILTLVQCMGRVNNTTKSRVIDLWLVNAPLDSSQYNPALIDSAVKRITHRKP